MANSGQLFDRSAASRGRARAWRFWLAVALALAVLPPIGSAPTVALAATGRVDTTVADFAACPIPARRSSPATSRR